MKLILARVSVAVQIAKVVVGRAFNLPISAGLAVEQFVGATLYASGRP